MDRGTWVREFEYRKRLFEKKFVRLDKKSCWEWKAAATAGGNGIFGMGEVLFPSASGYRVMSAHRAAYFFYRDSNLPFDREVECVHLCGNRLCVNPDHLCITTSSRQPKLRDVLEFISMRIDDDAAKLLRAAMEKMGDFLEKPASLG